MKKTLLIFTTLVFTNFTYVLPSLAANEALTTAEVNSQQTHLAKININKAKADEFSQLKGIGQKKAQAIIQYRKVNGAYNSLDDLLKVKGIGKKILLDNKTLLTI
jgi:competence protein ComEA